MKGRQFGFQSWTTRRRTAGQPLRARRPERRVRALSLRAVAREVRRDHSGRGEGDGPRRAISGAADDDDVDAKRGGDEEGERQEVPVHGPVINTATRFLGSGESRACLAPPAALHLRPSPTVPPRLPLVACIAVAKSKEQRGESVAIHCWRWRE
jgi:hypothetical protein